MQTLANLNDTESTVDTTDHLTKDMLAGAVPDKRFRKYITDEMVALINSESDSELRRLFRDNVLTYASVLTLGKYSLTAYINAVKFVSLKLMGDSASTAYSKVFPDRYQNLIDRGANASYVASFAANYAKTALITKIIEQTMVPTHILNAGIYQEAINTQVDLMKNAKSEMVRQKAAESLMSNLVAPAAAKLEIDINYSNDIVEELRATTRALAKQQMAMILHGQATVKEIAHSNILAKEEVIDIEVVEEK